MKEHYAKESSFWIAQVGGKSAAFPRIDRKVELRSASRSLREIVVVIEQLNAPRYMQ